MQIDPCLVHCARLVPVLPSGFRPQATEFFSPACGALVAPYACFGREKGVCDKLQRHPLIDPIFSQQLSAGISAPFARGNLHLVIPFWDPAATSPLFRCEMELQAA